jgi:hypothetical protein
VLRRIERVDELVDLVGLVANSHDHNCSPDLRGQARRLLGLGPCKAWQDCIAAPCERCGDAREAA